ncbi:MAG: D-alanyl-D-alanine carboxypeptidase family protein [Fusicatenibacter sp.]|nr:D-alanyl-D-alanine carboxypeptidase family protein [Fusicatenibacter sp.]
MKTWIVKKLKHSLILFLISIIFAKSAIPVPAGELSDESLYAKSACLLDGDSGRILYGKECNIPMAMASTTKIMTCIVALENGDMEKIVTASKQAAAQPKVHLGVQEGQQFLLEDLMYSLMLESHNDAAVMVAEAVSGNVEDFVALMNEKAREIGCSDTYFITPNGLDAADDYGEHHTTAADLAKIMRYCLYHSKKAEQFLEITETSSYSFWDTEKKQFYNCTNHNSLLNMIDGVVSGKTGYTSKAGYCYVGALEKDGKHLIIALLACGWPNNRNYKWEDARKLLNYGLSSYEYRDVLEHNWYADPIEVLDGQYNGILGKTKASVQLVSPVQDKERELRLLLKEKEQPELSYELPEILKAPVNKGDLVGRITYSMDGRILMEYPVYAAANVNKIDYTWCLSQVALRFFV